MKRRVKKEVRIDISETMQPTADGCERMSFAKFAGVKEGTVDEVVFNGVLEQMHGTSRIEFMRLLQAKLKVGGKAVANIAHYSSVKAIMNPLSLWPPLAPESFGYFNAAIRKASNYEHPAFDGIDFDLTVQPLLDKSWEVRSDKVVEFALQHYNNVVAGLSVTLTKRGEKMKKEAR